MIKKAVYIFTFIMLLITAFQLACFAREDTDIKTEQQARSPLPDTPRPRDAALFGEQDPSKVAFATELYNSFLSVKPEIFLLTHEGQLNIKWVDIEEAVTEEEYAFVKSTAEEITKDCTTDAQKIRAVAEYVAKNTCYDYDYSEHGTKVYSELALTPYRVLTEKNTVCEGYSRACEGLLQSIGIPCVYVLCPDHSWNMAYDGERWILFDSTWMSNGIYEYGKHKFSAKLNSEWYDFTFETACGEYNHLIEDLPYTVTGGKLTKYPVYSALDEIYVSEGVTSIGEKVFMDTKQTILYLPKSLCSISGDPFAYYPYDCKIEKVYIEDLKAWLGIWFAYTTSNPLCNGASLYVNGEILRDLVVPEDVTSIRMAFYGCGSLESVVLPNGFTDIGAYSFAYCENLRSIYIPESTKSIGVGAFSGCINLIDIEIPKNVESIGRNAFLNCRSLVSIRIPDGITSVGHQMFDGCVNLESIVLPESITAIDGYAFLGCSALSEIKIPEAVTVIQNDAFSGCSALSEIKLPDGLNTLGNSAFYGCSGLKEITLPKNITKLENDIFARCTSLERINLHDGITSIGDRAFDGCSSLGSIILPQFLEKAGNDSFRNCSALRNITIPSQVKNIGSGIFSGCTSLSDISLSDSITNIGNNTFYGCSSLETIKIPKGVTAIGSEAFEGCSSLISVTLPEALLSIGDMVFKDCASLDVIKLPLKLSEMGSHTFYDCTSLSEIVIPENVTAIGSYTFYGCSSLKDVTFHNGITSIGDRAFYNCTSLEEIVLPNSLETIEKFLFYGCTALKCAVIPKGVTTVERNAFYGCSALSGITIPDSVASIEQNAFLHCTSLGEVRYTADDKAWSSISIGDKNTALTEARFKWWQMDINAIGAKLMLSEDGSHIVAGIHAGTTLETLCDMLVYSDSTSVKVFDDNGNEVSLNDDICSGYKLRHFASDGTRLTEAVIAVKGDVNCDGKIDITDMTSVMMAVAGADNNVFKASADLDLDGKVTMADVNLFMAMTKQKLI